MTARDDEQERRPGAVLFVYTWDLALAILALFGALASFAGACRPAPGAPRPFRWRPRSSPRCRPRRFAATLIILASLLTRKQAWVRQMQIGTLAAAIALAAISVVVGAIVGNGVDAPGLIVTLIFLLLDALAIVIMTERRVVSFYDQTAGVPVYVWATLAVWVGGQLMIIVPRRVAH